MTIAIRIAFGVLFLLVGLGCQSTGPSKPEELAAPVYSESHIDFEKWKRTKDCCQASGAAIAIAAGGTFSSQAGLEIHRAGGNAVDAATAVAFTMAVERPHSLGLGGGGFLTLHIKGKNGGDYFFDFRETAPARASKNMYLGPDGNVVDGLSTEGALAVATPGFVAGWYEVHRRFGTLPWRRVLAPATRLAKQGFLVYPSLAKALTSRAEKIAKDPYLKGIFLHADGMPLAQGERLVQADLGRTLDKLARVGKEVFYRGDIARRIVKTMSDHKGLLDAQDLASYKVVERKPLIGSYKEYTYVTAPPPSAGGVILAQALNVLSSYDLSRESKKPVAYTHLLAEVLKRGYADRSQYIGDPDFANTGYEFMLSPAYTEIVRKSLNLERATPSADIRPGRKPGAEDRGTSHFSILDAKGNAVASTLTINDYFGALMPVPGTGILLNNEMDDFSAKPGVPNIFGLTGNDANAIEPGKRPVSSMTPTIILREGVPVMAVGGAGGSRIITSVMQVVLNNLIVFPGDLRKAVFAPRIHHQWIPDRLDLEGGFSDEQVARLKSLGYETGPWAWKAQVQAVQRTPEGRFVAVFDARDEGGVTAQ